MVLVDRQGNPLTVTVHRSSQQEKSLVEPLLDSINPDFIPKRLGADGNFSSDPLNKRLYFQRGIRLVAPDKVHYTKPLADKRRLRINRHRWRVERANAWIRCKRHLRLRYERKVENFTAFVLLACITTYLRYF